MAELSVFALVALGSGVGTLLALAGAAAWSRLKAEPAAEFTLTVIDGDGIPVRQQRMSALGVGRIITTLNEQPEFYK